METVIIPVFAVALTLFILFLMCCIGILAKRKDEAEKNWKQCSEVYARQLKQKANSMKASHERATSDLKGKHSRDLWQYKTKLDEKTSANNRLAMEKANLKTLNSKLQKTINEMKEENSKVSQDSYSEALEKANKAPAVKNAPKAKASPVKSPRTKIMKVGATTAKARRKK